ncbi:hypothetical protein MKY59_21375 [Paenibacillus sp. FSL W8-0426]|uniref:hypothetical protein n=1 Tax=Paenibacillus sp. FSL W8-0426 TaxID=2921714 RepID=UPI0030D9034E
MRITNNAVTLAGSSVAVPVDIQGVKLINEGEVMPVSGGGSSAQAAPIEITTIVNALSLRDGAVKSVDFPDMTKYVRYSIYVLNTLDQAVRVAPWMDSSVIFTDATIGRWGVSAEADGLSYCYTVPAKGPVGSGAHWLNELTPASTGSGTKVVSTEGLFSRVNSTGAGALKLTYRAVATPTTGTLTIRIIGYTR